MAKVININSNYVYVTFNNKNLIKKFDFFNAIRYLIVENIILTNFNKKIYLNEVNADIVILPELIEIDKLTNKEELFSLNFNDYSFDLESLNDESNILNFILKYGKGYLNYEYDNKFNDFNLLDKLIKEFFEFINIAETNINSNLIPEKLRNDINNILKETDFRRIVIKTNNFFILNITKLLENYSKLEPSQLSLPLTGD